MNPHNNFLKIIKISNKCLSAHLHIRKNVYKFKSQVPFTGWVAHLFLFMTLNHKQREWVRQLRRNNLIWFWFQFSSWALNNFILFIQHQKHLDRNWIRKNADSEFLNQIILRSCAQFDCNLIESVEFQIMLSNFDCVVTCYWYWVSEWVWEGHAREIYL